MTDLRQELAKWYDELLKKPLEAHLLCPKICDDDDENYKDLLDDSVISLDEKKKRIQDGEHRIEITYWNSLIFGFDKKEAGKWLDDFEKRLEHCLNLCPDCVLNWHMKRKAYMQKFSEFVHSNFFDLRIPH